MIEIHETRLPGVGIRFDFITATGERLGVIAHRSGRRELIVCSASDPDECRNVVRLEEEDVRALAEILGQSQVVEDVHDMRLSMQGLTIDWVPVRADAACAGCTVHEVEHRDEEAASIVAVVRDGDTIAAPPSSFRLQPGDTAVVVGTPDGVKAIFTLLQS
jgi:TrkA domain protein